MFSPEEVWALVARRRVGAGRARSSSPPRSPACAAASCSALRWRDVDFAGLDDPRRANYAAGKLDDAEVGQGPLGADGARRRPALAELGKRDLFTGDDDLVFAGVAGGHLDGDALSSRYRSALARANLRALRFHDLRHTFGTRMIAKADIRRVQEWMGHADIQTTMKYLHYAPRAGDAALVAEAFAIDAPAAGAVASFAE